MPRSYHHMFSNDSRKENNYFFIYVWISNVVYLKKTKRTVKNYVTVLIRHKLYRILLSIIKYQITPLQGGQVESELIPQVLGTVFFILTLNPSGVSLMSDLQTVTNHMDVCKQI